MANERPGVVLLSCGELPVREGLVGAQMAANVREFQRLGFSVTVVFIVPHEARLSNLAQRLKGKPAYSRIGAEHLAGAEVIFLSSWLKVTRAYSFRRREREAEKVAGQLAERLRSASGGESPVGWLFHCRSYYAAEVACRLRDKMSAAMVKVSFDMRSLLAPEFPLFLGECGKKLYGEALSWEADLLARSDVSFLPVRRGIEFLKASGIKRLPRFVPISGFHREVWERAPHAPRDHAVMYAGSFNQYHSLETLKKVFEKFPGFNRRILTVLKVDAPGCEVYSRPHDEIADEYLKAKALIVPGTVAGASDGYFHQLKVSTNFFSTKVAEALTTGTPLVVNRQITELAELVDETGCGVAFDLDEDGIRFGSGDLEKFNDPDAWQEMSRCAHLAGEAFTRERVTESYVEAWSEAGLLAANDG